MCIPYARALKFTTLDGRFFRHKIAFYGEFNLLYINLKSAYLTGLFGPQKIYGQPARALPTDGRDQFQIPV